MVRAGSFEMLVEVYPEGVGRIFSEKAGNHKITRRHKPEDYNKIIKI
jgi:hypothetical protein